MTTDGISKEDWDNVFNLSSGIVDATHFEEYRKVNRLYKTLFRYLDKLTLKYGEKPSILATKADYVSKASDSLVLFKRAYQLAENIGDSYNMILISSSLAELYLEKFADKENAKHWVSILEKCLEKDYDECEYAVLERIQEKLNQT